MEATYFLALQIIGHLVDIQIERGETPVNNGQSVFCSQPVTAVENNRLKYKQQDLACLLIYIFLNILL